MVNIPEKPVRVPENYPEELFPTEVKKRYMEVLGDFENPRVPLNVRLTGEEKLPGNVIRQRIEYSVEEKEVVSAFHMFLSDIKAEAPGVLAIHEHGGKDNFPLGKKRHAHPDPDDPMQYAYRAALSGFRVLAPDALCFGERQASFGYSEDFWYEIIAHAELCGRGKSLAWKSVWDNSRAIEVLQSLGAKTIGSIGHSGGSTQNYILAPANDKIKAAVCFFSFATLRHQLYQYRVVHCLYHYIPGMIEAGIDWDQVVALAAPRKFFFGWADKDEGSPETMYRAFVSAIEERCKKEGLPRSISVCEEKGVGHQITERMLSEALAFLQKNLM